MSMIDVDHQSSGVLVARLADTSLIWPLPARARPRRASKTRARPGDLGIGAEHRRRRAGSRIAARKPEPRAHDADRTVDPGHGFECLEQPALDDLRMFEHRGHVEDLARGNAVLVEDADHSRADFAASARSISAFNSKRRRLRSSRPAKRGSATSSSRSISRHSVSNCSCLLAAMFRRPSPVRNVPEGAAVILSLPIGSGFPPRSANSRPPSPWRPGRHPAWRHR